MKSSLLVCIVLAAFKNLHGVPQSSFLDAYYIAPFRILRSLGGSVLESKVRSPSYLRTLRANKKFQDKIPDDTKFPCSLNNTRSDDIPQSVHRLRPGDIKVIGAIGDSLTAGFGLTSLYPLDVFVENRGLSFSVGGQGTWREYLSVPNILKEFNPNLIGYSLKASLSISRDSQFNVAEGGAVSDNTPYMAKILVKRIKRDPRVNLEKDWKMISVMIGANDFCSDVCYHDQPDSVLKKHKTDMLKVLRILRDNLPRTFVNLIPPPNVEELSEFTNLPSVCYLTHRVLCPCFIGAAFERFKDVYVNIIKKWQQLDIEIANYDEFDREDFQVTAQPLFLNFVPPRTKAGASDYSYFAADCFHFSQKGNALVANALWNNLLEPVGRKGTSIDVLFKTFRCPTSEHPYLFTRRNSAES